MYTAIEVWWWILHWYWAGKESRNQRRLLRHAKRNARMVGLINSLRNS
jgi:hypothetical protein